MKIEIVVGTRPEIIKMAPLIRECLKSNEIELRIVHTGQHYDQNMSAQFFSDLELPQPDINFNIGSGTHAEQTSKALIAIEKELLKWKTDVGLAEGDTNSVLATALSAVKIGIPFGHVEAGIRSFDRTMPEEINRILADQCADFCFAPTEIAKRNLLREGIREHIIHVTGNTIVDACLQHITIANKNSKIIEELGLKDKYAIATIHRANNTDNINKLTEIVSAFNELNCIVVFPIHPRTMNIIRKGNILLNNNVIAIQPLGYLHFLKLLANARVMITDSGGIQEEASILQVPCITVRDNTERPETINAGVNLLVKANKDKIKEMVNNIVDGDVLWHSMRGKSNLYGDGRAAERIIQILLTNTKGGL